MLEKSVFARIPSYNFLPSIKIGRTPESAPHIPADPIDSCLVANMNYQSQPRYAEVVAGEGEEDSGKPEAGTAELENAAAQVLQQVVDSYQGVSGIRRLTWGRIVGSSLQPASCGIGAGQGTIRVRWR